MFSAISIVALAPGSGYAATKRKLAELEKSQPSPGSEAQHCSSFEKTEATCKDSAQKTDDVSREIAKLKVDAELAAKKERISLWNQKLRRFAPSRMTVKEALEKNFGSITLNDSIVFFENDDAFRHWRSTSNPPDALTARLEYASEKSPYIKACQAKVANTASELAVNSMVYEPNCPVYGTRADYRLSKVDKFLQIDVKKKLIYRGDSKNYPLVKQRFDNAQACIKGIYANHGIHLNFIYAYESSGAIFGSADEVNLYDEFSRNNALNWGVLASQGSRNSDWEICKSIAHEMGHMLGLNDTYPDPRCPHRPRSNSRFEIMGDSVGNPDLLRFNDQEIKRILDPLCADKAEPSSYANKPSGGFFSVGLGVQKFIDPIKDYGYVLNAGVTSVSNENGFFELQLNYSQPGLDLTSKNTIQDNFHFGYSQAILNFGFFLGRDSFISTRTNRLFVAIYFGVGLHVWNYKRDAQEKVSGNNIFAANKSYPNNQTAWVLDTGVSLFVYGRIQMRLQYSAILMASKPTFQTVGLTVQYNIF